MKTDEAHPSYPQPTIIEALCEIHFQFPAGESWQDSWFGSFFESVKSDHPVLEPRPVAHIEAAIGRQGLEHKIRLQNRIFVRSEDGSRLIQLSPEILTRNVLRPYPGWVEFRAGIERAFGNLKRTAPNLAVRRVGLRYINLIPRTDTAESLGEWLSECRELPQSLLKMAAGFALRYEWAEASGRRLVLNVGSGGSGEGILLDFDAIAEAGGLDEWSRIGNELETLHDRIWRTFTGMIGPKYREFLEGRKP